MFSRLSLLAFSLFFMASLQAVILEPGEILVIDASGDTYFKESPGGAQRFLGTGNRLKPDSVVITGIESKVVILFSSGSSLLVKPESQVHIQTYLDNRPAEAPVGATEAQIRLLEGDIVGSVKKLNAQSKFIIDALSYSAGIRGTDWWMKLRKRERYEMIPVPKPTGRAYKTVPLAPEITWGFGVAEGSAMLKGPGDFEMPVGDNTVVNVQGMLSDENTIEDAIFAPDTMPEQQFDSIMGAAKMMKGMWEKP